MPRPLTRSTEDAAGKKRLEEAAAQKAAPNVKQQEEIAVKKAADEQKRQEELAANEAEIVEEPAVGDKRPHDAIDHQEADDDAQSAEKDDSKNRSKKRIRKK